MFFDKGKMVASPQHSSSAYSVDLPSDKYDKLYYSVKSGDNVGYIADWYDVRASDLRYWNNISRNMIRAGQKLVIYKPKGKSARYREVNSMSFAQKQNFAGREMPATQNIAGKTDGTTISSGASAESVAGDGGNAGYVTYKVRAGDTLWEIARLYPGVSEDDIAGLNHISNASKIQPGQVIRIKRKS